MDLASAPDVGQRSTRLDPIVPDVAVCVTTRNRAHLLSRLVGALEAQSVDPLRVEIVITDDGSNDGTWAQLQALARRSKLDIHTVRRPSPGGPGAGRNAAWRRAEAPLIVFIDDDCVPSPGWLGAHAAALGEVDISQGRVEANREQESNLGAFSRTIGVAEENGLYETCNIGYRRAWLERLGGFDERFRRSGEDADLAWRAKDLGASTTFVPAALVYHDIEPPSFRRAWRDTLRWTGVMDVVDRHPHLAPRFKEGRSWRRSHLPAVVASLGLLAVAGGIAARRPWALATGALATVPYVDFRLRRQPVITSRRRRLRLLLPTLVLDISEVAVIAGARLRRRWLARSWSRDARRARPSL